MPGERKPTPPGPTASLSSPPELVVGAQTSAPSTAASPAPTFAPGTLLAGRYHIVRFIAQGGMGEVYEAHDRELGERVALKTVRPDIARRPGSIERLRREMQLARRVTHPNVCRLFDLGVHRMGAQEGVPDAEVRFLTMELLEGETLSRRIHDLGRLSPEQALPLVRQMAAALGTAHEAGIVHRDFKSSNVIIVTSKGGGERAVVTDFGLARAIAPAGGLEASLTGEGSSLGTPAYMAPEQVEGKEAGPAADIYSLGVVMYEMVTGQWPFLGQSPLSIAVKRLSEPPIAPRRVVGHLDPVWEATILRCLQRQPADRFASTAGVTEALERGRVPPSRARARRTAGALAAAAAVAGAFILLAHGGRLSLDGTAPAASAVAPRRAVAVLGFKNLGRPESAWLSTAVSEMLRTELAAGEKVRTIPGESVARMKMEQALADTDSLAGDSLARIRSSLGADLVVLGSYLSLEGGRIRLDLRLQDTVRGEVLVSAAEEATEQELFALVTKAGARIRQALAMGAITEAEASAVRASLPSRPEAARLYAEGLARLRVSDALGARAQLEKAVAAEPSHPLPHAALAGAWSALGYDGKAREEAQRAFEASRSLSREDRLMVEASYRQMNGEWERAVEIHRSLLVFFPDRLDYGLGLAAAQTASGRGGDALATIQALRGLPAPASDDPRIDLAEADAAKALTDFKRQEQAARVAAAKAREQRQLLLLAQARLAEADALVNVGRLEEAQRACEEALGVFAAAGDVRGVARSENVAAVARARAGDMQGAREGFEAALRSFRQIGDQRYIAVQLGNVAGVLDELGDRPKSRALYEEALRVSNEIGDRSGAARTLSNLGMLHLGAGDLRAARRRYEEALAAFKDLGQKHNVALALSNIGEVLEKQGELDAARARYEESLEISRPIGDQGLVAETLTHLASIASKGGDSRAAQARLEEALALYREAGEKERELEALGALAAVLERRGDGARAARLREEAAALERQRRQ
jgi:tetratricopeptide (TPR) repeat protein